MMASTLSMKWCCTGAGWTENKIWEFKKKMKIRKVVFSYFVCFEKV
jgi:hypothetical protein